MGNIPSFLTAIGVAGILGALLTYYLGLQKERWSFKRDLYVRLLEELGEIRYAQDELLELEMRSSGDLGEKYQKALDAREDTMKSREGQGVEKIRQVTSVARMMLSDKAVKALTDLQSEWSKASRADSYFEHVDMRRTATATAYDLIVESGKGDLRL